MGIGQPLIWPREADCGRRWSAPRARRAVRLETPQGKPPKSSTLLVRFVACKEQLFSPKEQTARSAKKSTQIGRTPDFRRIWRAWAPEERGSSSLACQVDLGSNRAAAPSFRTRFGRPRPALGVWHMALKHPASKLVRPIQELRIWTCRALTRSCS